MSLSQVGVNSLIAVNQWIGLINSNLISTSRTAYKTSRISFSDGLGINTVSVDRLLPPSTLNVQATTIEWDQGSIVASDQQTHFAIQGEGFFVLHNPLSDKYYLSRDGEFHWGDHGYLVNSAGLRVVSSGQDYIQLGQGDASDIFHADGYSRDLHHYGDKSFLLVDVLNRDNLRMSQYGSTVFEVDGEVTTRLSNDFNSTTDGVTFVYDDPSILPVVDNPGFVLAANPAIGIPDTDFQIDFGANGVFDYSTFNAGVAFNPNSGGDSIQDIVNAINAFGAGLGALGGQQRVFAIFDSTRDRLILENRVAPGANNDISFGGVNGQALAAFFRIGNLHRDELATPVFESTFLESSRDIDNSFLVPFKDVDYAGNPGPPPHAPIPITVPIGNLVTPNPIYTHFKGPNGFIESEALGGNSMILGESATSGQFDIVMNIKISNTDRLGGPTNFLDFFGNRVDGLLVFAFGQDDAHSLQSGGFEVIYNSSSTTVDLSATVPSIALAPGQVVVRSKPKNYDEDAQSPQVGGPIQQLPIISTAYPGMAATPTHRVAIQLNGTQQLTFNIDGVTASFDLGGSGQEIVGHVSLRNTLNILQLHDLHTDFKRSANAINTGEMVPVNIVPYASDDREEFRFRPRSRIVQGSLETSNASLTEYVPMLSLAQKVFSAVSKIISVYNSTIDDMNATIR